MKKNRTLKTQVFVGLMVLIIGLLAALSTPSTKSEQADQSNNSIVPPQPSQNNAEANTAGNQEIMGLITSKARHFRGDPNAPVTLIEFSDFQ